jgi:hypothetical protein
VASCCIFKHHGSFLTFFVAIEGQVEGGRPKEDPLPNKLLVLNGLSLLAINLGLQEDEAAVDFARIKGFIDKKMNIGEGELMRPFS